MAETKNVTVAKWEDPEDKKNSHLDIIDNDGKLTGFMTLRDCQIQILQYLVQVCYSTQKSVENMVYIFGLQKQINELKENTEIECITLSAHDVKIISEGFEAIGEKSERPGWWIQKCSDFLQSIIIF